jgi:mannose-6-phosphate isomerase-like protein (cupin superfamily)
MARRFAFGDLPRLRSTRDTRDRLDLVTDAVPVGATRLRADRIRYHPGDTAAAHYHADCHHVFYVLEGEGVLHVDERTEALSQGMVAVVGPGEVHWFSNEGERDFAFVEYWAPPPTETVWVKADDI